MLLTLVVVSVALYFSYSWLHNKPKARKHHRMAQQQNKARLVEVFRPHPEDALLKIKKYGEVIPYRLQTLSARVSSQVVAISPKLIPGAIVKKDTLLIELDPTDYRLALKEKEASVANAKLALQTELENQKSAKYDLSLFKQKISPQQKSYLLRYPHIEAAKATLQAQEAAYQKAKIDLERCKIYAPFDAIVVSSDVAVGDMLSSAKSVATLANSNTFWVKVALPPYELKGIEVPHYNAQKGSQVEVRHDFWDAQTPPLHGVVESLEQIDSESKMAYLLIRVDDPLLQNTHTNNQKPLLLNGFVQVTIQGKKLQQILKVPQQLVHNGNQLWILQKDNRLHITKATKLWEDENYIYLPASILQEGEALVKTYLEAPVEGMRLRTSQQNYTPKQHRSWHKSESQ